jgi:capsular exopolysaccharide synthesis family protein
MPFDRIRETMRSSREPGPVMAFRRKPEAGPRVDDHLVSLRAPDSFEAEHYRSLRYGLEELRTSAGLCVVGITSADVGDGKTTTAINLAGALSQASGRRVLLVDADLRRPAVGERLGLGEDGGPGLVGAVDAGLELPSVLRGAPPFNLAVLPAGDAAESPYEVLQSPRIGEILSEARRLYDFVILDLPPVLVVPDCRLASRWVDGFIVVVGAHKTSRRLLEETLDLLEPAKVVGLVFNGDKRPSSSSGYHGYYRRYAGARAFGEPWWRVGVSRKASG